MKTHIFTGTKAEIVANIDRIDLPIHEVIVVVDELEPVGKPNGEDIFAEMEPFTVKVGNADYSRESIYTRMEGE